VIYAHVADAIGTDLALKSRITANRIAPDLLVV